VCVCVRVCSYVILEIKWRLRVKDQTWITSKGIEPSLVLRYGYSAGYFAEQNYPQVKSTFHLYPALRLRILSSYFRASSLRWASALRGRFKNVNNI